ncbi:LuxR C-terminal-related transcriptional regulator [Ralstonia sp. CHL-2022]|uniref:LuxR C-terminal-related transcriptional regulator n=1 Tax=Ralstonia mojiangensis TaxID=2953895 RepID=A0ABT2LA86_9RALS|nr:LuxR C-terminal-related transcriptional regulator [Ralstonia mojiangensis]MCT7297756.1 LuxR C-terminal-related transcriptional regulator [Ralstonia mojiangensis]MCT7312096.1 LuxR C-terminal-related transcriptional regulator [Ralstonia mojiangensis]MCT7327452.1 LuxR C-terminal-related transcriptional regulator [Ralstonia mojiangensis]
MDLSTPELRALLEVTGHLHEPTSRSLVERPDLAQKIGSLLHIDLMAQLVWNRDGSHQPQPSALWGRDQGMRGEYRRYFYAIDSIAGLLQGSFEPVVVERKMSRAEWSRSEYFTDYLCRHQAYPAISLRLPGANGTLVDYRFSTSDPKKRFGDREISLLTLLKPHLLNAQQLRLVQDTEVVDTDADTHAPIFVLEGTSPPLPNAKARAILAGLSHEERDGLYRQLAAVAHGARGVQWKGFGFCVERPPAHSHGLAYRVHLIARAVGSSAWFQQQFGVTMREGEVCQLLLKGMSDKQIALALNMSYWTVRTHVGHIMRKVGVDSRSAIGLAAIEAGGLPK